MPEGDTVFLLAHRLHEALAGAALTRGEIRHPRLSAVDMTGWRVTDVAPLGKHLFVRFDNDRSLHSHLRMDGVWHLYEPGERWRLGAQHARVVLECGERTAVGFRLHDLALLPRGDENRMVGHLGPDLLADDWTRTRTVRALERLSANADREIGLALLDQRVVAGVGNIHMAETCFRIGVSPFTPVGALTERTRTEAVETARMLLRNNRRRRERTTTGDHQSGRRYWVYQRGGKPCRHCGTTIRSAAVGAHSRARSTWYCPRCQPETL